MAGMKLRFSIRDLLWLALVVALATGWWLDHRQATGRLTLKQLIDRQDSLMRDDYDPLEFIRELNEKAVANRPK
jgi:hypothetical protein